MAGILDILDGLGYALDTPGALTRGLLAGRPGERVGGRELLEDWGALGANQAGLDFGDVAGFGAELLLDPLNLATGGTLAAVRGVNKGITAGNSASKALRAAGAMPEEIAALTKIVDDSGAPLRTYHGTPHVFDSIDPAKFNPESRFGPGYYSADVPEVVSSEYVQKGAGAIDSAKQLADDEFAFLNRRLPGLREAEAAGLPDDMPLRHGMTRAEKIAELEQRLAQASGSGGSGARPNVRMQFIDSRKPLLIDEPLGPEDIESLVPLRDQFEHLKRQGFTFAYPEEWLNQLGIDLGDATRFLNDVEYGNYGGYRKRVRGLFPESDEIFDRDYSVDLDSPTVSMNDRLSDIETAAPGVSPSPHVMPPVLDPGDFGGGNLDGFLDQLQGVTDIPRNRLMPGVATMDPELVSPGDLVPFQDALRQHPILGGDAYSGLVSRLGGDRAAANRFLQDRGFDAIVAEGGGSIPHREIAAFDPSQIYSPYIAPTLRPEHRTSPLLAALAANNLGQLPYDLRGGN